VSINLLWHIHYKTDGGYYACAPDHDYTGEEYGPFTHEDAADEVSRWNDIYALAARQIALNALGEKRRGG